MFGQVSSSAAPIRYGQMAAIHHAQMNPFSAMATVLGVQVLLVLASAVICVSMGGLAMSEAALAGGAVAIVNLVLSAWALKRTHGAHGLALYAGAAARFLFVILSFGLAIGVLHLAPLPMLLVFGLTQLGHVAGHWKLAKQL